MNQERIKLFIILSQALGLLVTLICSFLGGIYIFNGQWLFAFPVSLLFVIALYYLVIYFCNEKEKKKKRGYPPAFYYLFGVYALLSVAASVFVLHFFNVEINEKKTIQELGLKKIAGLKTLYKEYDDNYTTFLNQAELDINRYLSDYKNFPTKRISIAQSLSVSPYNIDAANLDAIFRNPPFSTGIKTQIDLRRGIFKKFKENLLKSSSSEAFIAKNEAIITGWDRFSIVNSIQDLNGRVTADYDALNNKLVDKINPSFAITSFSPQLYAEESLINHPLDLATKHLGPISLLVLLLFQFLVLLPYFLTKGKIYGR